MKTVLLIERDEALCENMKEFLELYGYSVTATSSLREGFYMSFTLNPAVIICDSFGSGTMLWEPFRLFRRYLRTAHIPLLITTTCDRRAFREGLMSRGADGVFLKPFDPTILLPGLSRFVRVVRKVRCIESIPTT